MLQTFWSGDIMSDLKCLAGIVYKIVIKICSFYYNLRFETVSIQAIFFN